MDGILAQRAESGVRWLTAWLFRHPHDPSPGSFSRDLSRGARLERRSTFRLAEVYESYGVGEV